MKLLPAKISFTGQFLDCALKSLYIIYNDRGVEQLVARRAHNPKVTGSSPVPATSSQGESSSSKIGEDSFFS
jgi:hypothetical protein